MARAAIVTAGQGRAAMRNRAAELNIQVIDRNDLRGDRLEKRLKACMR